MRPEAGHAQAHVYEKVNENQHQGGHSTKDIPKGERASNRKKSRRLYRNSEEAFMGGVCAGLSDYFGIEDPIWIRMAFAISFFTGGWGLLPYILLWSIVPEAKTPAQKLAMRGEPINVSNIEKIVKEGMDNLKTTIEDFSKSENGKKTKFFFKQAKHEVKKSAPKVFKASGSILKGFFIFLGIVMLISLGTALIAIVGSLFIFSKPLVTFVLSSSMPIVMGIISTLFLIGIPILFISYAVLRRSFNVRLQSASWGRGLGFLWILSLISLIAVGGTTYDNNFSSRSTMIIPGERLNVNAQTLHLKILEDNYYSQLRSGYHNRGMGIGVNLPDIRFDEVIFDNQSKAIYENEYKMFYDVKNVTNTYGSGIVGKTWLMTETGLKESKIDSTEDNEFEGGEAEEAE
ncbi:MAG: PspC domain-containing protein [Chitinophagales bacterium]